ncbi:MAG: hypothetical protein KJ062_09735 [Thermoanaerobaculia bacterium]|nr:hypothetical protein [Thermoanaerobaculia bacterium]
MSASVFSKMSLAKRSRENCEQASRIAAVDATQGQIARGGSPSTRRTSRGPRRPTGGQLRATGRRRSDARRRAVEEGAPPREAGKPPAAIDEYPEALEADPAHRGARREFERLEAV